MGKIIWTLARIYGYFAHVIGVESADFLGRTDYVFYRDGKLKVYFFL